MSMLIKIIEHLEKKKRGLACEDTGAPNSGTDMALSVCVELLSKYRQ